MSRLRWPLRLYVLAVMSAAIAAVPLTAAVREDLRPTDEVLLALVLIMATAAQLWPVHISLKVKLTVDDPATFAAALLLGPFYSMIVAGVATLIAQHFRGLRQRWYNRGFNAATSALSTAAAGAVFLALAGPSAPIADVLWAVALAAAAKYIAQSTLVDLAVALQVRRNPLLGWWRIHRRLLPYEAALLVLGALAALAAETRPWTLALFGVPMAVVLFALRESARAREQARAGVFELAELIDRRDPYTIGRSQRVSNLAARLARKLQLPYADIEIIRSAARVLDVGKIGTNELVLEEPGPLIEEEEREMRRHAENGFRFLRHLGMREEADLVLAHHERYDGAGYPRGLAGERIPIEAAVIAVCDGYEAMTSDRPYRDGLSWEIIHSELVRQRGKQWSERVVDALIELIEEERRGERIEAASTIAPAIIASGRALP